MQQKQCFVKTDWTYLQVEDWINGELKAERFRSTGSCSVKLKFISGNDEDKHCAQRWTRMIDFSRTASATIRYMMLHGTGLLKYHNPKISYPAKSRNKARISCTPLGTAINDDDRLARNAYEAKWISARFDMLFPHFHVENQLEGIKRGEVKSLPTNQLLVMDTHHHTVWRITVALRVTRLEYDNYWFKAVPSVQVDRYEWQLHSAPEYPFPFQQPVQDPASHLAEATAGVRLQ